MKIIFLNALRAELSAALADFVRQHAATTDVFCFQESSPELEQLCAELLPAYTQLTASKYLSPDDRFDQLTVVRPSLEVIEQGTVLADTAGTGLGLYTQLSTPAGVLHLVNVHGKARPGDKLDDPARLSQTSGLLDYMTGRQGSKVIGGDFNLLPETESIASFRRHDYRDLIHDWAIPATRNHLAWDRYPDQKQLYSDYVFVDMSLAHARLTVPDVTISDHLPLILEF